MQINNKSGYALLTLLLSTSISCIILWAMFHYLHRLYITYNKQLTRLENQQNKILTLQHLSLDIHNSGYNFCNRKLDNILPRTNQIAPISSCNVNNKACTALLPFDIQQRIAKKDIKPNSDILILNNVPLNFQILENGETECTPLTVLYYLRSSVINRFRADDVYALYRDDILHNSAAIAEGYIDFKISISQAEAYQAVKIRLQFFYGTDIEVVFTTRNEMPN